MKLRIVTMFISVATVSALGVACNPTQAKPECLIGRGVYAAKYAIVPGQSVTGACALKKGEQLGLQKFVDKVEYANYNKQTIAIKPSTLAALAPPPSAGAPQTPVITQAKLTAGDPDKDNRCTAVDFPPISALDASNGTIGYHFSNVSFYDTAQIPGTQFTADLAYTEGGCTANYKVTAVFPAISCESATTAGTPDSELCKPQPGNFGATLNPNFAVTCDPDLLLCVLSKPVPALITP